MGEEGAQRQEGALLLLDAAYHAADCSLQAENWQMGEGVALCGARLSAIIALGRVEICLTDHAYLQAHAEEFQRAVGEEG